MKKVGEILNEMIKKGILFKSIYKYKKSKGKF